MAYTFDDIKDTATLLANHYGEMKAAEMTIESQTPVVSSSVLQIMGTLSKPLNEDDKRRFDQVVDKIVETRMKARRSAAE